MSGDDQQDKLETSAESMPSNGGPPPPAATSRMHTIAAFSCAAVVFFLGAMFYFSRIHEGSLFALPQFLLLIALITPCLLWQTLAERTLSKRISLWSSGIIWVAGIAVAFVLGPSSPFIVLSDGLMLLGFVPVLYMWRFSIPWIIFGGFNLFIGLFLLLLSYMPDQYFPENLWAPKHHLAAYHPYMTWLLFGVACIVFGIVRMVKNIYLNAMKLVK